MKLPAGGVGLSLAVVAAAVLAASLLSGCALGSNGPKVAGTYVTADSSPGEVNVLQMHVFPTGHVTGILEYAVFASNGSGLQSGTVHVSGHVSGHRLSLYVPTMNDPYWTGTLSTCPTGACARIYRDLDLRFLDTAGQWTTTLLQAGNPAGYAAMVSREQDMLSGLFPGTCTMNYPDHDAIITLAGYQANGTLNAWEACQALDGQGYWWDNSANSANTADTGDSVVCTIGTWGPYAGTVVVRDSGGQVIGSQLCQWLEHDWGISPTVLNTRADFYGGY